MSNKGKHNDDFEESYQFPEEEHIMTEDGQQHNDQYVDDGAYDDVVQKKAGFSASMGAMSKLSQLKNKRVILVIGGVIVVLVLFTFMRHSNNTQVIEQKPVQPVVQQPSPMQSSLDKLRQSQESSQSTVNDLQTQVSSLKSSLSAANQSQAQLTESVSMLSSQVRQLAAELQAEKTKPVVKKVVKKHVKQAPQVTYHVKAILPGRAWLIGSDGSEKTVTIGNHLANYGVIKGVDATNGMVMTSSGKVIDYGDNDN